MPLVVIESPFAGDIEKNIEYARSCMRHSLLLGETPIASHLLYTQQGILNDDKPNERKIGIEAGFAWGVYADKVVFYTDNGMSGGMQDAYNYYNNLGITIEFRNLVDLMKRKELLT